MSAFSGLIANAQAIPAAAFVRARCVTECAVTDLIDLTDVPAQRSVVRVPTATISLVEAAGEHFATLSR